MTELSSPEELSLNQLLHELANNRGLDLRGYKTTSLERRIRKRMAQRKVGRYSDYLELIRSDPEETNQLLNTVLINVTEFFRDPQAWEVLRTEVLPQLLGGMRPGDTFRAWSAGCASGEEPFSLAILLADYFGPRLPEFDIKIYATDIDEEALDIARRGEYPADRLRRLRPEWRTQYFKGGTRLRINRDIRRLVIFGRSNILKDAPISHCQMVLCRNLLIYFDTATQRQILNRLHYALEPGGILFLGKAESKLGDSHVFRPIHARWRIFQKAGAPASPKLYELREFAMAGDENNQRLQTLSLYHRSILEALRSGIIQLDGNDNVIEHNEAALSIWGLSGRQLSGKRLQNSELILRCPELAPRLEESHSRSDPFTFRCTSKANGQERIISVTLKPVLTETGERAGTVMHCEDVTAQEKLQITVEQLETTTEELQSANEELETTNEELQSTNEELETTNEELQSTNEELETTNEELQSLNEELENTNEELEHRTRELNQLTERYAETLTHMPWPVMLVDPEHKIQLWNAAAQKLFGVGATSVVGVKLAQLPIDTRLAQALLRRCRGVLQRQKSAVLRKQRVHAGGVTRLLDVHFTPIARDSAMEGVLVMFGPAQSSGPAGSAHSMPKTEANRAASSRRSASRRSGSGKAGRKSKFRKGNRR